MKSCLWILLGVLSIQQLANAGGTFSEKVCLRYWAGLIYLTTPLQMSVLTTNRNEVVALWRTASQSSQYGTLVALNGVDGDPGSCSHTQTEDNPWWKLELRSKYKVNTIKFTNVDGAFFTRIDGAEIRVGIFADDIFSNPVCAVISSMAAGATSNFSCGGMEGRYIIFLIPGTGKILNVCELTVYGYMPENAALWRTAVLASQTGSSYARNALDGLPQTCAQTTFQPDPWIRLNLLNEYRINVVTMINSLNLGYVPLNGTTTRIGNDPSYAYNNPSCTKIPNASPVTSTNFSCGGMVGRYVFVHVPGYMAILTLCELEIYGDLIDNRASVGVATQSSTSKDWSADRAIDGDRGLQQINKGCSSTLNETSPWLRVDLLYFYAVNRVVITNRNISNAIQMTGLEIHIGSSLENNGNNNPICAVVPGIPMGESYNYTCNGMIGRYINLILPGDFQMLTLCEVEVFGKGPVLGRSFVRMHFSSTMDLTDQTISKNILQQLKSALAGRGYANMTFVWSESPKMVLGMQKMTPAQHCIKVP